MGCKRQQRVKNGSKDFDLSKWRGTESGGSDTTGRQTGVVLKTNL